ncbi:hypothetical protein [Methylobacterium sp. J-067]|uniref:hypothetical protein n=1 Tax=Methylobacterium sp. J-067 TaxID=2836648 RepID=UPI001FBAF679|nr:hypothetical protein [Methylobacterium sp. J-067]MCJ2023937.1 hypothetical protein [Methylobacterium sp. J-067]
MSNVFTFPDKPAAPMGPITARWEVVASYGEVGPLRVALTRRLDMPPGFIHVAVIGTALITIEPVTTLPDDANGRAIADFTGPAVLRAIEHAEVEFVAQPEAC